MRKGTAKSSSENCRRSILYGLGAFKRHSANGKTPSMTIYNPFSVVEVPFPFIDSGERKKRPALVLSDASFQKNADAVVLAMITSAERSSWEGDIPLRDWKEAGLRKPSILRWKLFTIESAFILGIRSSLSPFDKKAVQAGFSSLFSSVIGPI